VQHICSSLIFYIILHRGVNIVCAACQVMTSSAMSEISTSSSTETPALVMDAATLLALPMSDTSVEASQLVVDAATLPALPMSDTSVEASQVVVEYSSARQTTSVWIDVLSETLGMTSSAMPEIPTSSSTETPALVMDAATTTLPTLPMSDTSVEACMEARGSLILSFTEPDEYLVEVSGRQCMISYEKNHKPKRPCPFCGVDQVHLKRHIMRKHSNESAVADCRKQPEHEQRIVFDRLRKQGIYARNKQLTMDGSLHSKPLREKSYHMKADGSSLKICGNCKGFLNSLHLWHHKRKCGTCQNVADATSMTQSALPARLLATEPSVSETFKCDVVSHLRDDECGRLCSSDKMILSLGQWKFEQSSLCYDVYETNGHVTAEISQL